MISLRQSTSVEKPLQASKWLQSQALLSRNELSALFEYLETSLGTFFLYYCGVVCSKEKRDTSKNEFLDIYDAYIHSLMNGQAPDLSLYRSLFSPSMTVSTDALFTIPVGDDRQIVRISRPVIQMQAHNIDYSQVDKKFHSMVFGTDSIAWGIQFSYPQLFQDNETREVELVKKGQAFPNTALFQLIQKWMRQHTIPTPFIADGKTVNVPMRLGKECLPWINQHSQLVKKHISVKT
ncbi:MAG TPA: hypothetical protein VGP47_03020 [Parachlamydiaceae bacterium]|nr:hypothetical protein [Parachlamydiaceae bacterium]